MKPTLATFLLAVLAVQTFGVPLHQHWCGGALATVSPFGGNHDCCAGDPERGDTCHADRGFAKAHTSHRSEAVAKTDHDAHVGAEAETCCRDELVWELQRVTVTAETEAQTAPHAEPATTLHALSQVLRPTAAPVVLADRGPPITPAPWPASRRRAALQVYVF